jgi:uncharacterized phage infection (PIP) family protein YhgE
MESFKRPEMIVSVVTATGLIGSIIYFYKQESALRERLKELSEHLTTTINKVRDIQKDVQTNASHIIEIVKAVQEVQGVVNKQGEIMKEFERLIKLLQDSNEAKDQEMEDLRATLDTVIGTLQDQGITFDFRPKSRKGLKGAKAKKKPAKKVKEPSEEDESSDEAESSEEEVLPEKPSRSRQRHVDDDKAPPNRKKPLTSGRILEKLPATESGAPAPRRSTESAPLNRLLTGIKTKPTPKPDRVDGVIEEPSNQHLADSDNDSGDDIADEVAKVQALQQTRRKRSP